MPTKIEELTESLVRENEEFAKAKQAHAELAKRVDELESKAFLTPQDEMELKNLKKKKLAVKDQMERILLQHR